MADAQAAAQEAPIASKTASSKLEEQATAKADLSYSFWASQHFKGNGAGAAGAGAAAAPRKLTEEEAQALQEAERNGSSKGASAWNQAGTFEERCVTDWAKGRLGELLVGVRSGTVITTGVSSITGDANIWFVRGKRRCGFDFDITLSWRVAAADDDDGAASGSAITGTVKLPSACTDDLDDLHLEASVASAGKDAEQAVALADAKRLQPALTAALTAFYEELKDK